MRGSSFTYLYLKVQGNLENTVTLKFCCTMFFNNAHLITLFYDPANNKEIPRRLLI